MIEYIYAGTAGQSGVDGPAAFSQGPEKGRGLGSEEDDGVDSGDGCEVPGTAVIGDQDL